MSVALQLAAAEEIATELRLAVASEDCPKYVSLARLALGLTPNRPPPP